MKEVLVPRVGQKWRDQATWAIDKLQDGHRVMIRPGGKPQKGCYPDPSKLDLVTLTFDFASRSDLVVARFQRVYAIHLLRALREAPRDIVVGYGGNGANATYRSTATQRELWEKYKAGIGGKAAPPCSSFHEAGLAADCPCTDKGRAVMEKHDLHSGASFGDPSHFSLGVVG